MVHSLVDIILASQELRDVWFLWKDFREIGLPERHMRKPYREHNLNSSRGVISLTELLN